MAESPSMPYSYFQDGRHPLLHTPEGDIRAEYRPVLEKISSYSPEDLISMQKKLVKNAMETRMEASSSAENTGDAIPLDFLPHIIPTNEWETISKGIIQRTLAFDCFVKDIYSQQKILKERVIPYQAVLRDPVFMREMVNVPIQAQHRISFAAADLTRTAEGKWVVVQNHFALPTGSAFSLLNRRMLRQAFPEVFEKCSVQPVASFTTYLLEALRNLSPNPSARIIYLHRESPEYHVAMTFMARRMGLAMAQPSDLLVRESQVYLKTIAGLQKIDVIYRYTRSTDIDPVAFASTSHEGTPGLMSCLRKGSVAVANMPGSGIADNRALLRHSDRIIRHYLREEPILKTLTTFDCGDRDQADYVEQNLDTFNLFPIQSMEVIQDYLNNVLHLPPPDSMRELLRIHPRFVAAQPADSLGTFPRFENGTFKNYPTILRVFVLLGKQPYVLPGGLTLQQIHPDCDTFESSKDTWVIGSGRRKKDFIPIVADSTSRDASLLSSRAAESIYWMGRYSERAENTARMIKVLLSAEAEELGSSIRPLWMAVAQAAHPFTPLEELPPIDNPGNLINELLFDPLSPSSAVSHLQLLQSNAERNREYITPEVWRLVYEGAEYSRNVATTRIPHGDFCDHVTDLMALLNGTLDRTMPHDEAWHFFKIGALIERAQCNTFVLHNTLIHLLQYDSQNSDENPDLTTLLRLLCSLDPYRREYQSRVYVDLVTKMLWQNTETPSSLAFCCQELIKNLEILNLPSSSILEKARHIFDYLQKIECHKLFPRHLMDVDRPDLFSKHDEDSMLSNLGQIRTYLQDEFLSLHSMVEDAFFSHQAQSPEEKP